MPRGVYTRTEEIKKKTSLNTIIAMARPEIKVKMIGRKFSKEHLKNLSKSQKGRVPWNKGKLCPQMSGENHYLFGKHHSDLMKEKLRKALTGRKISDATKYKMSLAKLGKKKSEITRERISEARKGVRIPKEARRKISETRKKLGIGLGNKYALNSVRSNEFKERVSKGLIKYLDNSLNYNKRIRQLRSSRIKKPTKPQLKLFETIKTRFPDKEVVMEQIVKTPVGHKFIDVAIPELKLGFEWDEPTYHGIFRGSKEKDAERHLLIEAEGWQLTHYSNISEFKKIGNLG